MVRKLTPHKMSVQRQQLFDLLIFSRFERSPISVGNVP
jgi:hypothetical protein